jgi:hypothetical protein
MFTDFYGQQSCTAGRAALLPVSPQSAPASQKSACPASHSFSKAPRKDAIRSNNQPIRLFNHAALASQFFITFASTSPAC